MIKCLKVIWTVTLVTTLIILVAGLHPTTLLYPLIGGSVMALGALLLQPKKKVAPRPTKETYSCCHTIEYNPSIRGGIN